MNRLKKSFLTPTIWLLSVISLFTDVASEMLYPVIPLYLQSIGYGVVAIGFLEGISDALAGLSKGYFGQLSDRLKNRSLFIKIGYGVSALSKPVMGLFPYAGVVFAARLVDRFGKGIRTAPRDALLSSESTPDNRGKVFGFHRSMDTLGATIGPIVALVFLYFFPKDYRQLFTYVLIPGAIALVLTFLVKDRIVKKSVSASKPKKNAMSFAAFYKNSSPGYKKLLTGLILLALINGSDMFLILRTKELGLSDIGIITAYIGYNLIFTLSALPLGALSDRFGFKKIFIFGMVIFTIVYTSFSVQMSAFTIGLIFCLYGLFAAVNEAVTKAWLSKQLRDEEEGTGLGLYMSLHSAAFLIASIITGLVWHFFGSQITFSLVSISGVCLLLYFAALRVEEYDASTDLLRNKLQ